MEIVITVNENVTKYENLESYKAIINKVLSQVAETYQLGEKDEMSIVLCDNEYIHKLNKQYRNIDRPTDVLSFALNDGEENPNTIEHVLWGDIVISLDRTKEQAEEYGHGMERELAYLTVHGALHLLGYDHMEPEDKKEMRTEEEYVLSQLGYIREGQNYNE